MVDLVDFEDVRARLHNSQRQILADICPAGRVVGGEWKAATANGGKGDSFSFNVNSGKWADYAVLGCKGGDIVSLYAWQKGVSQPEAAKILLARYGHAIPTLPPAPDPMPLELIPAPKGEAIPEESRASGFWVYKTYGGEIAFVVYRFDPKDGKKFFRPISYAAGEGWVAKAWPKNRPLFNLEDVRNFPQKQIIVVEGEKAASALKLIQSSVVVVTWSGGAQAVAKTDWAPLRNRNVILWPDNDDAGFSAMQNVAEILHPFCTVKTISTPDSEKPKGWDAADAIADGWSFKQIVEYVKPRVKIFETKTPVIEIDVVAEPPPPPPELPVTVEVEEDYPVGEVPVVDIKNYQQLGMKVNEGKITLNEGNVFYALMGSPVVRNLFWFDTFHQKVFTTISGVRERKESHHVTKLLILMQQNLTFEKLKKGILVEAFDRFIREPENVRNEPVDWLNSLKWDGTPRIDAFFGHYMGAKDSLYTQAVSKNFWLSLVARVTRHGCKVDNMVILEGAQGIGKSTALSIIGGEYYAEIAIDPTSKDFIGAMAGKFLIEIGELASFTKSEAVHIKQMITSAMDVYRKPYGEEAMDVHRKSVFVGTTNSNQYLKDETGNRRFWPVATDEIKLDEIKRDREQFFAESLVRINEGESWHEVPRDEAEAEQNDRLEIDEMTSLVESFLLGKYEIKMPDLWTSKEVFGGSLDNFPPMQQKRIARVLRLLGWETKVFRDCTSVYRAWRRREGQVSML